MQHRPSAERTRSRRWRSGTRRNKKHPIAHHPLCGVKRRLCLVHSPEVDITLAIRLTSMRPALAMRLTQCEQRWVDDMRARRPHAACRLKTRRWQCVDAMRSHIRKHEIRMKGEAARASHVHINVGGMGMGSTLRNAIQADAQAAQEAIMAGAAEYPRRMDISDRWYPRGE